MLTRCPACSTTFRAPPDLLKVRGGQVRCGECGQIFNALDHLFPDDMRPGDGQSEAQDPEHDLTFTSSDASSDKHGTSASPANSEPPEIPAFLIKNRRAALGDDSNVPPHWITASKKRFNSRPLLITATVLLAIVFVAQAAFSFRAELAVALPELKPQMAMLCAQIGCTIPLPKNADSLIIEASDLQADSAHANVLILNATLKNRARYAQQHPALELTLTSDTDQPLARRTLTSSDYLDVNVNRVNGFPANGEIAVRVFIDSTQVKPVGYRLFLFYP